MCSQRYTYRVLQTIHMKVIFLCVWTERAALSSTGGPLLKYGSQEKNSFCCRCSSFLSLTFAEIKKSFTENRYKLTYSMI